MALSIDQFGKALVTSGLVTAAELKAIWAELPADKKPADGNAFAAILRQRGLLSDFQADEILSGRDTPLVLNQYVLLAKIGAGGMGQVFKAQHRKMKRLVAIKLLPASMTKDEGAIKRFQREVEAAAKLTHPNIVAAHDADECRGLHYLVMEYVEGQDLSVLVKQNGPLAIELATDYILQAARGLAYAHAEGVVHRDIKPANLLLDRKGVVKILDMGLARIDGLGDAADHQLTNTGQVMGTVDYMAPEQATDTRNADARSDVYSLGCSLYRLLTGGNVFEGDTLIKKIMAHMQDPVPSLASKRPGVSAELERIFAKMMAKKPADRYQNAAQLVTDLEAFRNPGASSTFSGTGQTQLNPELSNFLKSVNTNTNASAPSRSATVSGDGATEAFGNRKLRSIDSPEPTMSRAVGDVDTDPKSEVIAASAVTAQKATAAGRAPRAKSSKSKSPPVKLIAAGALGVVLVLFGIVVLIRDDKGNKVAEVVVPPGGSVEVKQTPPTVPAKAPTPPANTSTTSPKPPTPSPVTGSKLATDFALHLKDRNDGVEAPNPRIDLLRPFTVEAYVTPGTIPASGISDAQMVGINGECRLDVFKSGWSWYCFHSVIHAPAPIVSGRRVHLAGVRTLNQQRLYVDGKLVASKDEPIQVQPDLKRTPLKILPSTANFLFRIDELRITQGTPYTQDFTPPARFTADKDTLLLYHFDEGQGNVVNDSSGKNLHGKLTGGQWVRLDGSTINTVGSFFGASSPGVASPIMPIAATRWPFDPPDGKEYVWSEPENLGPKVNDAQRQYYATTTSDQLCLILNNQSDARGKSDLVEHRRASIHEPWGEGTRLTGSDFENLASLSPGGLSLFYDAEDTKAPNAFGKRDIYLRERATRDTPWGPPQNLGPQINSSANDQAASLSPDGLVLVFSSDRAGGRGANDLYIARREKGGKAWSAAQHLGDAINDASPQGYARFMGDSSRLLFMRGGEHLLAQLDKSGTWSVSPGPVAADRYGNPWPTPDGRTLYFNSHRLPGGLGDEDIWVTRRVPKENLPLNAGVVYLDDLQEVEWKNLANKPLGKRGKYLYLSETTETTILFRGKPVEHTLWMHPSNPPRAKLATDPTAFARYQLDGRYATFAAEAGIHESAEKDPASPVTLRLLGDGRELWKSQPMQKRGESAEVVIDIRGVKELRLETASGEKTGNCHATWFMPRLTPVAPVPLSNSPGAAAAGVVYLDDLQEIEWKDGNGKLGKHGLDRVDIPFTHQGKAFTHALFTHPLKDKAGIVRYALDGKFETLAATVGLADITEDRSGPAIQFRVLGDGRELWKSHQIQKPTDEATFSVSVVGVRELQLEVATVATNSNKFAHAVWLDPRLTPIAAPSTTPGGSSGANVPGIVYLDDLPEKDWQGYIELGKHGDKWKQDGSVINWQGAKPAHALTTYPLSNGSATVTYELGGRYSAFQAVVGITVTPRTPLTFRVSGDGKILWESPPQTKRVVSGVEVNVDLRGVETLKLEVLCPGDNSSAHAVWINPRLTLTAQPEPAGVVYLDDLTETESRVLADLSLGKHGKYRDLDKDEETILWRGKPVTHSLWMHPPRAKDAVAFARYQLEGKYQTFAADAGIQENMIKDPSSPVTFRVLGDGRELWKSPPLQKRGESAEVSVDVRGVKELRLEASSGEKNGNCHATWFMPRLTPVANTALAAPPAAVFPFDAKSARSHQEAWSKHLGVQVETANSIGAKLTLIPPGEFLMGSTDAQVEAALRGAENAIQAIKDKIQNAERPQHRVVITKPFLIGTTEVTIGQFRKFVEASKYITETEQFGFGESFDKVMSDKVTSAQKQSNWRALNYPLTDDSPVGQVTWNDAVAFCKWLSEQEQGSYRLPTEAEWEFACRAGTTTQYSFGDDEKQMAAHGNVATLRTTTVGTKVPNPFGLFDMHGNVLEWCADHHNDNWYAVSPVEDPLGPTTGSLRVLRGGGCNWGPPKSRSAIRDGAVPTNRSQAIGFRIVRMLDVPPMSVKNPLSGLPGGRDVTAKSTLDLLPLVDLKRDVVSGGWNVNLDGLVVDGAKSTALEPIARLELPYAPPDEYDFEIEFTSSTGDNFVGQVVSLQGRSFAWLMNAKLANGVKAGFELIDGQTLSNRKEASLMRDTPLLRNASRNRARVEVRKGQVRGYLNDGEMVSWSIDPQRMGIPEAMKLPHPERLGLITYRRSVTFHRITVREVTGRGTMHAAASSPTVAQPSTASNSLDRQIAQRLLDLKFPVKLRIAGKVSPLKPGSPLPDEPFVVFGIDTGAAASVPRAELVKLLGEFRQLASVENTFMPTQDCDLWAEAFGSMPKIMAVNAARCEELTDIGAGHLARLPKLEYVNIGSSFKITSVGLSAFAACKSLTTIELPPRAMTDGKYTLADVQKLQDALPMTRVVFGGVKPIPGLKPADK